MRSPYNHILYPQSSKTHLKLAAPISRKFVTDQKFRMTTAATYKVPKVENESNVRSLVPCLCPYTQQFSVSFEVPTHQKLRINRNIMPKAH